MKRALTAACLLAATGAFAQQRLPGPGANVVYGVDDRWTFTRSRTRDPVFGRFHRGPFPRRRSPADGGVATLATHSYADAYNLCKEEPFFEQEVGAFCSGSLVGPDVIMTAGHCVPSAEECANIKFVFGFAVKEKATCPNRVPRPRSTAARS